jgi:hypothetical protein
VVAFCNQNSTLQFDFNYASTDIFNFTNDGIVNQFNPDYTANDYVKAINDYFRFNMLKKYVNSTFDLVSKDFFIDQMLLSCRRAKKTLTAIFSITTISTMASVIDLTWARSWRATVRPQ